MSGLCAGGDRGFRVPFVGAVLAAAVALATACNAAPEGTGKNTNWLSSCATVDDCGAGLDCLCGVCSRGCEAGDSCAPGGQCASAAAAQLQCLGALASGLCLSACEDDGQCGTAQVCVDGACAARPGSERLVSPQLVGNNAWYMPLSDEHWQLAGAAGLKIVRIGGIDFDNTVPSLAELEDWVGRIKSMGAEPMIQVSRSGSPAEAASLVRHFNVDTQNPVRFWNIGNEPELAAGSPALSGMAAVIAAYVRSHASAMREVDPTIRIFAPDLADFHEEVYAELLGSGPNGIAGMDASGHYYIDGISWHRQVGGEVATAGAADLADRIERTRALLDRANVEHVRAGAAALSWGIGEFNANDGALVHTFANGQFFGQVLGHAMKHGATYACTWSIFESGGNRQASDLGFIDGVTGPRASYYHMQLVAEGFAGASYARTESTCEGVRAFGATAPDGAVVLLINVDDARHDVGVALEEGPAASGCWVTVAAGIAAEYTGSIEGKETQSLVFDGRGELRRRTTYNAGHFDQQPPTVEVF